MNTAKEMIERLDALDVACHKGDDTTSLLLPVTELSSEELAWTSFSDRAVETKTRQLPYVNAEGKPIGAFSRAFVVVDVYSDGTAIARHRTWAYDYYYDHQMPNVLTLDGKPKKSPGAGKNHMTVKFYLLGCKHEYEERNDRAAEFNLTLFHCDHLNICKKCGHRFVTNSSD